VAKRVTPPLFAVDRRPPLQKRSIARHAAILEAARTLFAEKGYEATSIGDLVEATGIAAGAFYLYFESKRQLLIVLMNELLERLDATDLKPQGDLREFLASVFETDLAYYGVIRAWHEASLSDPELYAWRQRVEEWTHQRILHVFKALSPRGEADLPTFARMMDRHFWDLLGRAGALSARQLQRELTVAADVIRHYLFVSVIKRAPR
jgi:AcrR family transcriptional regulator